MSAVRTICGGLKVKTVLLQALARIVEAGDVLKFDPAKRGKGKSQPKVAPSGKGISYEEQKANRERARQEGNERAKKGLKGLKGGGGGGGQPVVRREDYDSPYDDEDFEVKLPAEKPVVDALEKAWEKLDNDYSELLHANTSSTEDGYYRAKGMPYSYAVGSGYIPNAIDDAINEANDAAYESASKQIWSEEEALLKENGMSSWKDVNYNDLQDVEDGKLAETWDELRDEWLGDEEYVISMGVDTEDFDENEVTVWADVSSDRDYVDASYNAAFSEVIKFKDAFDLKTKLDKAFDKAVKYAS